MILQYLHRRIQLLGDESLGIGAERLIIDVNGSLQTRWKIKQFTTMTYAGNRNQQIPSEICKSNRNSIPSRYITKVAEKR